MDQGHIDKIISCYNGAGEFKVNEKYSRAHETVYTRDGDKYHWLVVEQKGSRAEVRQTDVHGKITAWDTYERLGGSVRWIGAERLRAEGRGVVRFGTDEINAICQAAKSGMAGQIPEAAADKLSALSSEIRSSFISTAARQEVPGHRHSVLKRLAEINGQRESMDTSGRKMQKKAERDTMAL